MKSSSDRDQVGTGSANAECGFWMSLQLVPGLASERRYRMQIDVGGVLSSMMLLSGIEPPPCSDTA